MARLNIERQKKLEPLRFDKAKKEIEKLGFKIIETTSDRLAFVYKGSAVLYYPYSGWATGRTIKDGRGLKNLLKQIKDE